MLNFIIFSVDIYFLKYFQDEDGQPNSFSFNINPSVIISILGVSVPRCYISFVDISFDNPKSIIYIVFSFTI